MADTTGVQVFVGPANQLELGDVVEGPTGVTLETIDTSHQRIHFSISAPTAEVLAEAESAADSAATAQAAATAAQGSAAASATSAATAATNASASVTEANGAKTAAQAAQSAAEAAAASVTDEMLNEAVLRVITPGSLLIDTDGRPYFA
ncbi:hypothetical protein Jinkies_35 [Arthrobacter phage Jinkies]|uniref:Uncharacterized protein n=1 Tax=Arthrobacter phage Jinkies TaxID=2743903 RepID=A0A7S6BF86_9CAUD|nr:hypothetical protein Jinkies_35 [Arthrobacter phage Jinkies]